MKIHTLETMQHYRFATIRTVSNNYKVIDLSSNKKTVQLKDMLQLVFYLRYYETCEKKLKFKFKFILFSIYI